MFKNYFITAIRRLVKNKSFSALNMMGLALGMTCSLLIFLWVNDERQMDKFNEHNDRLFRLYELQHTDGKINVQLNTPALLPAELKRVIPAVQYATGFGRKETFTFQAGEKKMKKDGSFADADFFKMFSYKIIEGNAATALNTPSDIAISRSMAEEFFGSPQLAVGKILRLENKNDYKVTVVFGDVPENSSLKFDYLLNWNALYEQYPRMKTWEKTAGITYVMLKEGVPVAAFEKQVAHFLNNYSHFDAGYTAELAVQRFDEMYLYSNFNDKGQQEGGRIEYVRLFSFVALFVLLIACINFMNLTTAGSVKRAREIGVRKAIGAVRSALIGQFIGEAIVMAFFSMIIALLLLVMLLPAFNALTQKQISYPFINGNFYLYIIAATFVTGLVSGSYPALFLSSFNPVKVLKGTLKINSGNTLFRKALVVFQFVMAIFLIIGTIVIAKQVHYIQTKNLGFNRQDLIYVLQDGDLKYKYKLFKEEALRLPGIKYVSRIGDAPTNITSSTWGIDWQGKDPGQKPTFNLAGIGYDFIKDMDMQIVQGRDFSKDFASDSAGYILNEEAVRLIGYKDPIGKSFTLWDMKGTIIGVVKDFHFNSMHSPISPLVLFFDENDQHGGHILVKTQPGKAKEALAGLSAIWSRLNPAFPFNYQFADEEYDNLYKSEQMVGHLSNWVAFVSIFISCLGLLGLVIFTTTQRTKEIGIRKVLGANSASLFGLVTKEFVVLVVIALLIASPLAWLFMNNWLQDYAYRINISWWIFMVAGLAAIVITIITISFQTLKVILTNPVKTLRTE